MSGEALDEVEEGVKRMARGMDKEMMNMTTKTMMQSLITGMMMKLWMTTLP